MSQPTDFEVVTWAIDNGWAYDTDEKVWNGPGARYRYGPKAALTAMRRQYAAAHRPPLAERIAEAAFDAVVECDWTTALVDLDTVATRIIGGRDAILAAVQRVLDEEGEPQ